MLNIFKSFLIFFLIVICYENCFPQLPVAPSRPSPNAVALGQYGEIPVSLFTGVPQINVPLKSIVGNKVEVPISISYHSGGFRPDMHPSWVGLGWSLNAGGVITREIRGIADESNGLTSLNLIGRGYYFSFNELNKIAWETKEANEIPNGIFIDREPDVFKFNFLGFSGEFFLDHRREWKVRSEYKIKVEFEENDFVDKFMLGLTPSTVGEGLRSFNKFTLIDDKGNRYIFGTADAIEYSVGFTPYLYDYVYGSTATSWYLVKIIPQTGEDITFTYERGPFQTAFGYYEFRNLCNTGDVGGNSFLSRQGYMTSTVNGLSGSIISPVYLTTIKSPKDNLVVHFHTSKSHELKYHEDLYKNYFLNQNVKNNTLNNTIPQEFLAFDKTSRIPFFQRNPEEASTVYGSLSSKFMWLKLDSISFNYKDDYDDSINHSHRVLFHYDEDPSKRLVLDSLSINSKMLDGREKYSFKYTALQSMSDYVSVYTDHWGFANYSPIETAVGQKYVYELQSNIYQKRKPDAASLGGLLSEIVYPTGGYTRFHYGNHTYSEVVDSIRTMTKSAQEDYMIAGGARIESIESFDVRGGANIKRYFYEEDFDPVKMSGRRSSGILNAAPKYNYRLNYSVNGSPGIVSIISSSAIVPLTAVSTGRYIGYSSVVEWNMDSSFKATYFTSDISGNADIEPLNVFNRAFIPSVQYNSIEFEKGKKYLEMTYAGRSENFRLLEKKVYSYSRLGFNSGNFIRAVRPDYSVWCGSPDPSFSYFPAMTAYYNYSYAYPCTSIKTTSYTMNGEIDEEINFEFDSFQQPIKTSKKNSSGSIYETRYRYPHSDPQLQGVSLIMKNRNIVSLPIFELNYLNSKLVGGVKNSYAEFNNFIELSAKSEVLADGSERNLYQFTRYNNKGRLLEAYDRTSIPEVYVYGYGSDRMVAHIKGSNYNEVISKIPIDTLSGTYGEQSLITGLKNIHFNFPKQLVNTFTYNSEGNISSIRDSRTNIEYFQYKNDRLTNVTDINGNLKNVYEYHWNNRKTNLSVFYNKEKREYFRKNNCQTGYDGSRVEYIVPPGKYISYVSQSDADAKAMQDINDNGQLQANIIGTCILAPVPCTISLNQNWQMISYNIFPTTNNTFEISYVVMMLKNANSYSTQMWYNDGVPIGVVDGPCRPLTNKYAETTVGNRDWVISVDNSGIIRIRMNNLNAPIPVENEMILLENLKF
ncbi:DUF5977 domain-containing protein [Sphingobacterium spiritivorum]|uniref:DUF5977 domain-containing protein n=1 Tax=Sphingobacterium spiritivorum TaxID=258 RepID=UPI003DA65314